MLRYTFGMVPLRSRWLWIGSLVFVVAHGCQREVSPSGASEPAPDASPAAEAVASTPASEPASASSTAASPAGAGATDAAAPPKRSPFRIIVDASDPTPPSLEAVGVTHADRIAIGRTHVCALESPRARWGGPFCWGDAREGRIGLEPAEAPQLVRLVSLAAVSLAAGDAHTCAIVATGEVMCWGSNARSQLGITGELSRTPVPLALGGSARQLAAGGDITCAIVAGGRGPSCWAPGRAVHAIDVPDAVRVAVGPGPHGCALDAKGGVSCWSWDATATASPPSVAAVEGLPPSEDVGVGDGFTCALGHDRRVRCWGSNAEQRLGQPPTIADAPSPMPVPELPASVEQLSVGARSACALLEGGAVWCWGANAEGQLGRGAASASAGAARVEGLAAAKEVAVAHDRACALTADDEPWCWGVRAGEPVTPMRQVEPARWLALADTEQCAVASDGRVGCWGVEESGRSTPGATATFVEGIERAAALALPDFGGCALVDGRARCWGSAAVTEDRPEVPDESKELHAIDVEGVRSLAGLMERVCAIDGNKRVWCWGSVDDFEADEVLAFGPTMVAGIDDAEELALTRLGPDCARRSSGAVACWRPSARALRAKRLGRVPSARAIAGEQHVCVLTTSNAVWCTAGDEPRPRKVKVELPGPAMAIATATEQVCVLLESGQVACWEDFDAWEAEEVLRVPVVHGLEEVEQLVGEGGRICARRRDGSSACWVSVPPGVDWGATRGERFDGYREVR